MADYMPGEQGRLALVHALRHQAHRLSEQARKLAVHANGTLSPEDVKRLWKATVWLREVSRKP